MHIKNLLLFVALYLAVFIIRSQIEGRKHTKLTGYMVIKDNNLYFNEVEIVKAEDKQRLSELDLDNTHMSDGYGIINKNKGEKTFKLADEVIYKFVDSDVEYLKESENNRLHTTTEKNEFIKHLGLLNDIPLSEQKIPYLIELKNLKVISIVEELKYSA